jgi:alginate O-acetyltransferase complex protein AlgJ
MITKTSTELRRFLGRLAAFLLPLAGLVVAEQATFCRGWWTFRMWEQLVALSPNIHPAPPFPGPFYPRQAVTRSEQGDLGFHTPLAARRTVTWQTDRFGYRNPDSDLPPVVVIVGDSMIAGSSLDQSEILSTQLAHELGVRVVNLAPASVPAVLLQDRFLRHKPKVVIEGMAERTLEVQRSCAGTPPQAVHFGTGMLDELAIGWWVTRDRQMKEPFLSWAKSRWQNKHLPSVLGRDGRTLFSRGDKAHAVVLDLIGQGTQALSPCRVWLAGLGIAYMPLIIPDKETIYWDLLPSAKKPATYQRALAGLAAARLPVIDLDAAFTAERPRASAPLYPHDETHWSARAVTLTSHLLAARLKAMGVLPEQERP